MFSRLMVFLLLLPLAYSGCRATGSAVPSAPGNAPTRARVPHRVTVSDESPVDAQPVSHFVTAVDAPKPGNADDQQPQPGQRFVPPPDVPAPPEELSLLEAQREAVPGPPLALESLEDLACQRNPTLLQAQAQIDGELGKAIQAGLWPNPTLMYVAEQVGVEGTAGEFHGMVVQQRIVTADKLGLSREKFLMRTSAAEWHAMAQNYRVLNDVRMHYFRARGRQEIRDTQLELLKNAEDLLLTTRERYNVGQAILADVHQANAALQRQRLKVLMAENDYRQTFEELQALVGIELPSGRLETPLQGDLTALEWESVLDRLLTESPQIQEAQAKLAADRITIRREVVEPVPDIVIEAGSGYNFESRDTVAMARAAIEIPLFDRNQGTIRQAEADYARQQGEVRRIELMLRRDLANQYRTYLTALQHVRDYQEVVLPESRRAYELLLESYAAHRAPWIDVLNAEETYFQLRVQYIQNLMAWREAEVLILGYLLHGGLQAPTEPMPPGHIDAVPRPR